MPGTMGITFDSCGLSPTMMFVTATDSASEFLMRGGFAGIDAALEERAVFDRNTRSHYIASKRTIAANIYPVACGQISAHFTEHNDFTRIDIGRDHAIAPHGHAIA